MPASSHRLTVELAERLAEILPSGYSVHAKGDTLEVYVGDEYLGTSEIAGILDREEGGSIRERVESAAWATLAGVQDYVLDDLTCQWPVDSTGGVALPGVRCDDTQLHLWFGSSEAAAALTLRPIQLRELIEPTSH